MTITAIREGSPFDAIRRTREDGAEYWSARDLMAATNYERWENFSAAIDRAACAADNQNQDRDNHFRGVTKKGAGRPQQDVELTRFGAYLVMMNGDPRKPEIAAAQAYFAVRTREAEVREQHAVPTSFAEALRLAADQAEQLAIAAAKAKADAPLVAQAQTLRLADGLRTIPDLANDLQLHASTNYPGIRVYHQHVFDLAGRLHMIVRGDTVRANQPTAQAIKAGWVRPKETVYEDSKGHTHVKIGTRLTPRGYARLWDAAVANLREHGAVLPTGKALAS